MTSKDDFNSEQWQALTTIEGPVLVLAGAGSGKTRVVTSRIAYLIEHGIPPSSILGVTFTNKAAAEMRERVQRLTQHQVLISTFHSLGVKILRECIYLLGYEKNFTIYDEDDIDKLLKECIKDLQVADIEVKPFRQLISRSKNGMLGPTEVSCSDESTEFAEAFPKVYALYQQKLKDYHAVDFDDLLTLPVKIWSEYPEVLDHYQERWPFLLIDEYQDTNAVQNAFARLLAEKRRNIFVVGDPDQSIYSWRGANIQNILKFGKEYPDAKIIRLEQNYRSSMNILQAANALISRNKDRYEKDLWSALGEGEKIRLFSGRSESEEARFVASKIAFHHGEGIPFKEIAVLYRTNAQSRPFEDVFLSAGIPYVIVGGISFYQRREIKDVLAFLRLSLLGSDYISFARTINLPKRGIGETTLDKMRLNANAEGMTILAYCHAFLQNKTEKTSLRLNTKQRDGLASYLALIDELRSLSKTLSISQLVLTVIEKTGYMNFLDEDKETAKDRQENLNELVAKAVEWETNSPNPSLEAFLEELTLKSSLDESDSSRDHVSLMTLHHGKGLEFKTVFLAGMEENLFPHVNSRDNLESIEEERRLCYVGMTRAKEYLYLSHCAMRYLWGNSRTQRPSRFIHEIPVKYFQNASLTKTSPSFFQEKKEEKKLFASPSSDSSMPLQKEFSIGDRIFHGDFGIGQVLEVSQGSMGTTYKIFFDKDQALKTIVAKYARLHPI